jgi:hypothetical protein
MPLIPNKRPIWFMDEKCWCYTKKMSFYGSEVEPSHKEAPTNMDENSSSGSDTLNQIVIKR